MTNDNRNKVISWIRNGMDYYDGIQLIVDITHKAHFYGQFNGKMKSMSEKLAYEICKAAGVADVRTWKKFIQEVKDSPLSDTNVPITTKKEDPRTTTPEPPADPEVDTRPETLEQNPLREYPPIIRRIIHEYASLFQERSKLHAVMTEMDPSNAPAVVEKRQELFDIIKGLSVRLEQFHEAKSKFETDGTLPVESELFPPEDPVEETDISTLDELELKKRKKNLQNSNSKDQSLLDYQSKDHGDVKNPMPAGPKRIKIEYRMAQREKLIQDIETALLKYVVKN